jgi:hypothetical protein
LTIPKIKDLVDAPAKKYENMYSVINKTKGLSLIPDEEKITMKNELKDFLRKQINDGDGTTDINSLGDGNTTSSSYSLF